MLGDLSTTLAGYFTSVFGVNPNAVASYITGGAAGPQAPPASVIAAPAPPIGMTTQGIGVPSYDAGQQVSDAQIAQTQQNITDFVATQDTGEGSGGNFGTPYSWIWIAAGVVLLVGFMIPKSVRR